MNGFESLAEYVAEPGGDACPALVFHIDAIRQAYPSAPVIVIVRQDALDAACRAWPDSADALRAGWGIYWEALQRAVWAAGVKVYDYEELRSNETVADIVRICGGVVDTGLIDRWQALRITSTMPDVVALPTLPVEVATRGLERFNAGRFNGDGLTVRLAESDDFLMFERWAAAHDSRFPASSLPPLGVVVEIDGVSSAALWCFETYGVAVAWLEYPLTRPGLKLADASRALAFGAAALLELAGAGHTPPAKFTRFRICADKRHRRVIKRLGFTLGPERDNFILHL